MAQAPSIDDLTRSAVAPEPGRPGVDPHAQRGDPPDGRRRSLSPTIWRRRSLTRSPGSASRPPTPSDPARRRRTCRRLRSRASRTRTSTSWGGSAILQHVSRCWASLFTERAVTYRAAERRRPQEGLTWPWSCSRWFFAEAAGVLFTADPVTSNRKVVSVEASFGLGEALVSGLVNADVYKVRDGEIVAKAIATKQRAIHAVAGGRDAGAGDRAGAADPACADGCAGRATRAAGPADRGTLRVPPGHRMVPRRRRLPDRPEPADHHAVPHPCGRRP